MTMGNSDDENEEIRLTENSVGFLQAGLTVSDFG